MPVTMKHIRGKIRTVEAATGKIARTSKGNPVDGGGWPANRHGRGMAARQVEKINAALKK